MNRTPTLFDGFARSSDPDTSHAAARADRSTLELQVLTVVRSKGWVGATLDDVHEALNGKVRHGSVSRRLTSLVDAGLVEVIGKRRSRVTNRDQSVYRSVGHLQGLDGAA